MPDHWAVDPRNWVPWYNSTTSASHTGRLIWPVPEATSTAGCECGCGALQVEIERLQAVNKALQDEIASVHTEYKYAWDEVVDLEERNGRMLAELAGRDEPAR